ncbi:MAG: hypothetical protein JSS04_17755 [Proteobacteria bacterium]|nr:hypothetical protein [Pseudomonadota bacterium]
MAARLAFAAFVLLARDLPVADSRMPRSRKVRCIWSNSELPGGLVGSTLWISAPRA